MEQSKELQKAILQANVKNEVNNKNDDPNQEKQASDVGNAIRLVDLFGDNLRFVTEFKKWIYWDGNRWIFDADGHLMRCAKYTAKSIIKEISDEMDITKRSLLMKHSRNSENQPRLNAMIELSQSEEGVSISQSILDQNKYLLGVNNGVINLKTGTFMSNSKDEYITKRATVKYDSKSTCPRWLKFLNEVTNNNEDLIEYLQKLVGYSLTGDTSEQKLFFLYGGGANGKSVFVNTIQNLLGDYALQTPVSTLMTRGKDTINNDVARLRGARFVATTETEEGSKFNESEVKLLTGGDRVTARFLHQEHFEYKPQFKILISGNHKPTPGNGHGIWRRLALIPFLVKFEKSQIDKGLEKKLKVELSGILNWAIEGCIKWQEEGLVPPKIIEEATNEYKTEMDRVNSWMEDCCDMKATLNDSEKSSDLYCSYKEWAKKNGEWEMSHRIFGNRMSEKNFIKKKKSSGKYYSGIRLLEAPF